MQHSEFRRLVGAEGDGQSVAVSVLTKSGYACAGHFHSTLNEGFEDLCIILNAQLFELAPTQGGRSNSPIQTFNDFLEDVVVRAESEEEDTVLLYREEFGKQVPIIAVPYREIAVVYPVSQIGVLMKRARAQRNNTLPRFLDLDQSEVIKLLRTRLW